MASSASLFLLEPLVFADVHGVCVHGPTSLDFVDFVPTSETPKGKRVTYVAPRQVVHFVTCFIFPCETPKGKRVACICCSTTGGSFFNRVNLLCMYVCMYVCTRTLACLRVKLSHDFIGMKQFFPISPNFYREE